MTMIGHRPLWPMASMLNCLGIRTLFEVDIKVVGEIQDTMNRIIDVAAIIMATQILSTERIRRRAGQSQDLAMGKWQTMDF